MFNLYPNIRHGQKYFSFKFFDFRTNEIETIEHTQGEVFIFFFFNIKYDLKFYYLIKEFLGYIENNVKNKFIPVSRIFDNDENFKLAEEENLEEFMYAR